MRWRTFLLCVLLCSISLASLVGIFYLLVDLALRPVQVILIMLDLASRGETSV